MSTLSVVPERSLGASFMCALWPDTGVPYFEVHVLNVHLPCRLPAKAHAAVLACEVPDFVMNSSYVDGESKLARKGNSTPRALVLLFLYVDMPHVGGEVALLAKLLVALPTLERNPQVLIFNVGI